MVLACGGQFVVDFPVVKCHQCLSIGPIVHYDEVEQ